MQSTVTVEKIMVGRQGVHMHMTVSSQSGKIVVSNGLQRASLSPVAHSPMHASVHSALSYGAVSFRNYPVPPYHVLVRLASSMSSRTDAGSDSGDPSSSTVLFPFPKHKHPTPYEIFHLKPGASPSAVKNRCESDLGLRTCISVANPLQTTNL